MVRLRQLLRIKTAILWALTHLGFQRRLLPPNCASGIPAVRSHYGALKSPRVLVRLDHFEAPGVEKSLKFPELARGASVEESLKGRVFFRRRTGGASTRQETPNTGF